MHNISNLVFKTDLFQGKRFLITGASSGIGKECAIWLSHLGATLILSGRDTLRLEETRKELQGLDHTLLTMDLGNTDLISNLVSNAILETGPLNGLFHAAGLELVKPLPLVKGVDFKTHMTATAESLLFLAKTCSQKKNRVPTEPFSMVSMSSVASITGQAGMSVYAATKSAIDGIVRALAVELAPQNIRVNSIVSGAIETPMHDRIIRNAGEVTIETYKNQHLLGFGTTTDIANAVIFLLSDASRWITGTQFVVDGGYTCR